MSFPFHRQLDYMDCGPACLKMIAEYYGKYITLQHLREKCYITREGVSLLGISEAADQIGFRSIGVKLPYKANNDQEVGLLDVPLPCIAYWKQMHFIVVYKLNSSFVWVADPAHGKLKMKREVFEASWGNYDGKGIALALEPRPDFNHDKIRGENKYNNGLFQIIPYLNAHSKLLFQFALGLLAGLLFQLIFPLLTQSLVDIGIGQRDLSFVTLILIAQMSVFIFQTIIQFLQSWILLQIGQRVGVHLVTDFLQKLMRLPIGFFDSKNTGDLLQRISDNHRIQDFLTGPLLNIIFTIFTLPVFSVILLYYNPLVFFIFIFFSSLYVIWVYLFMKWRRNLDFLAFQSHADNQQNIFEIIGGMSEIKLQGSERKRRWLWLEIQGRLFKIQSKSLALKQYEEFGASFINKLKDIIISAVAARAVINGNMTLGMMMSSQYIVAQLNAPFDQLIQFLHSAQEAKISLERMNEVTAIEDEDFDHVENLPSFVPNDDIRLENLSFCYSPISPLVLENINFTIPKGKVTAIVGASGSGKTTLLKLLLGFYQPTSGKILIGEYNLKAINKRLWRKQCGAVMQDGFIFSDSIGSNISESDDFQKYEKLQKAIQISNLEEYISSLPLELRTQIGQKGVGLSQGQKQRLLIARAIYKDPNILIFDEATNALDANNEKEIVTKLDSFFKNRTAIIVAHRLSTVKNADKIIVLDKGRIVEEGSHESLVNLKGKYFTLIQNQLELGN